MELCSQAKTNGSQGQSNPITDSGKILDVNPCRKQLIVQNASSTEITTIGLGYQPDATHYDMALAVCSNADDDGTGGVWIDTIWKGQVFLFIPSGGKVALTEMV